MPKASPEYELVLMLDPEISDERRDEITVGARRQIEAGGGLKQERAWGLRKLSYEIQRRTEADYRFFRFERGDSLLDELNHSLRIADGVLRYRIFKVDADAPVVDPPPPISFAPEAGSGSRPGGRRREERPPRAPEAETPEAETPEAETPKAETPEAEDTPAPEPAPEAEAAPEPQSAPDGEGEGEGEPTEG